MKNIDFDNLFKNQLERLPEKEFLFEENSWDSVEGVLEAKGILPPVKQNWKGFLPIFLIGMLLFSNSLVSWKYYNAEQEIVILNNEIQNLGFQNTSINNTNNQLSNNNDLGQAAKKIADNEPKIKIVERIVEKIVYVPVHSSRSPDKAIDYLSNSNLNYNKNTNTSNDTQTNNLDNQNGLNKQNHLSPNSDNTENVNNSNQNNQATSTENANVFTTNNENNILVSENITNLDLIQLTEINNPVKQIHQPLENIIDTTTYQSKLQFKDYLTRIGYATQVSNFEIGLSGGLDLFYRTTDFKPLSTKYGITSEITFSNCVKLGTIIDLKQTKGELDNIAQWTYSDEYFDDYPNMIGLNVDDKLNKIEAKDKSIEFSVFAKYIIQPHKKWSPYFGFGIKGEYDYEQKFEYKYLDGIGYEYEMDYVYSYNKQLGFNTLLGLTGLQYQLSPNINLRFDAMYNYDYKSHRFDDSQMNWFSTNIGILYNFK